ncbi:MAG: AsmA family protein [Acidobacteriaceae bacterium]|nr:AsmA family protein [Acidobacteriaceae bacterium]
MAEPTFTSPTKRRRILFIAGAVLLVLLLALTPPLMNVSRLQRRIVTSISASLGRPVHIESASLHLLPMPGFTLKYIVVNEDPAFGNEPIIRGDTVEATLRVASLWRRQVEFSTVRFIDPSVNIVRNGDGRWNLESLLMHASRMEAAPTDQKHAGDEPRFPYIEATNARVNLKLGDEKTPYSLTAADFALWLPEPNQWRVRVEAQPARTDTGVSDPGTLRIEGAFERADQLGEVPVDLKATWHDVQLGEASRLLTGEDANWRGRLHLDIALVGHLNNAHLSTHLTVNELRRADFVPDQMLDLNSNCQATFNAVTSTLQNAACLIPDADAAPLSIASPLVDLHHLDTAALVLNDNAIPLPWAFSWAKLLSQRIPATAAPEGSVALHLERSADAAWAGNATVTLSATSSKTPQALVFNAAPNTAAGEDPACKSALVLAPTAVRLEDASSLQLNGQLSACGYGLHASGSASTQQLQQATAAVPFLFDTVNTLAHSGNATAHLDLSCARLWSEPEQHCSAPAPAATTHKPTTRRRR